MYHGGAIRCKKTYIDSGVLINAFRGTTEVSLKATQILDDPTREFASNPFVKLEALPKAIYNKQQEEAEFYEVFLAAMCELWSITSFGLPRVFAILLNKLCHYPCPACLMTGTQTCTLVPMEILVE